MKWMLMDRVIPSGRFLKALLVFCLLLLGFARAEAADVVGTRKVMVLRVYFQDYANASRYTKTQVEGFFGELNTLFQQTSYGKLSITYVVSDLFQLPDNRSAYIDDEPGGDLSNGTKFTKVLTDAIANSPAGLDWTSVDSVHVVMAETSPTQFHRGQATTCNLPMGPGGPVELVGCAIFSENPSDSDIRIWGRWAHELGHTLQQAGPAHPSNYNNSFELMDSNLPGQTGVFEKLAHTGFPGWMPPFKYQLFTPAGGGGLAALWAMEYDPVIFPNFQAARIEITPSFYYMVSVRRRILGDDLNGFFAPMGIPDEGVLIERVSEGSDPWVKVIGRNAAATCAGAACNRNELWKVNDFFQGDGIFIYVTDDAGPDNYIIRVAYQDQAMQPDVMIYPWRSPPGNAYETTDIWIDGPVNGYGTYRYGMWNDLSGNSVPTGNGDDPVVGQVNRLYARVRNIGSAAATGVQVTWEITDPPGVGIAGATGWAVIGTVNQTAFPGLANIAAGTFVDVYVNWTPSFTLTPAQMAAGRFAFHTCLRVKLNHVPGETVFGNQDGNDEQENISYFQATPPGAGAPYAGAYDEVMRLHNSDPVRGRTYHLAYKSALPPDWTLDVNGGRLTVDLAPLEIRDIPVKIMQGAVPQGIGSAFGVEVFASRLRLLTNDLDPTDLHPEYKVQGGIRVESKVCHPTKLTCEVTHTGAGAIGFRGHLTRSSNNIPSNTVIRVMAIGVDKQRRFLENTRTLLTIPPDGKDANPFPFEGTLIDSNGLTREIVCMFAGTEQLCASSSGYTPLTAPVDTDGDGIPDHIDNCLDVPNPDQLDTDKDGYGNACDADLNNDGIVNSLDLGLFKGFFGRTSPNADFNADGRANSLDLGLFKRMFGRPPGRSGLVQPSLLIAYPTWANELRLVFSEPVDPLTAEDPANYSTERGLVILSAAVVSNDARRVTLRTAPMNGNQMIVDVVRAVGVRARTGAAVVRNESPRFIQGIASIRETVMPGTNTAPFTSRFHGIVATHSCGDGEPPPLFGFTFLWEEVGGPFSAIKVVTRKQIPGIAEAITNLPLGKAVHVLWAGGEIRTENGETRLVDTGFMEGSIVEPVLNSPPPHSISAARISQRAGNTLDAKSLQGVVVQFSGITIDSVSDADEAGFRSFVFHDDSGEQASGIAIYTVVQPIQPGQQFSYMRGLVHQPRPGQYEVIVGTLVE